MTLQTGPAKIVIAFINELPRFKSNLWVLRFFQAKQLAAAKVFDRVKLFT